MKRYSVVRAVLVVTAMAAMGVAPAFSQTPAATALKAQLYEAAKREGTIVLWGPPTDTVEKYYPQEFQKAFPGIAIKAIGDAQAPQKLLTEALAGQHQADVFWWPVSGFLDLEKRGLVAKFDAGALAAFGIEPGDTTLEGRGLRAANVIYTLEYDTRRLKREELPRT